MYLQKIFVIIMTAGLVSACGVVPRSSYPAGGTVADNNPAETGGSTSSSSATDDTASSEQESPSSNMTNAVLTLNDVKASLLQAYRDWQGTPYVLGGTSQKGVDCSQLVSIIFDDYFSMDLPTNTREQLNVGNKIRRAAVRTGDLVFFRTGRKTMHVGIAVNSGEFLHASTSNGVMISKLGKSYWRNRFLAARRVF